MLLNRPLSCAPMADFRYRRAEQGVGKKFCNHLSGPRGQKDADQGLALRSPLCSVHLYHQTKRLGGTICHLQTVSTRSGPRQAPVGPNCPVLVLVLVPLGFMLIMKFMSDGIAAQSSCRFGVGCISISTQDLDGVLPAFGFAPSPLQPVTRSGVSETRLEDVILGRNRNKEENLRTNSNASKMHPQQQASQQ